MAALVSVTIAAACAAPEGRRAAADPPPVQVREAAASDRQAERQRMVDQQVRARGVTDERVLAAMLRVPRHRFVPDAVATEAYADHPLPIGEGQTISQPYIVGYMTAAADLAPGDRVLEIGTGSGYQAAVLAEIAAEVYTIEIIPSLAESARRTLTELGYRNVRVRSGNGYLGWPEAAPFDAIVVTAAPPEIPAALVEQLAVGAKMAIPVGEQYQEMVIVTRREDGVREERAFPVLFVPMTGRPPR